MNNPIVITALAAALGLAACTDTASNRADSADAPSTTGPTTAATDVAANPAIDPAVTTGTAPQGMDTTQGMSNANPTPQEREALGTLHVVNEHEVAAGNQALSKKITGEAADYARRMVEEHTRNRDMTSALNPDAEAAMAVQQRAKGEAELERLSKLDGDAYRDAYLEAMVKDHTEALDMLDNKLIPAATTPAVQDHLRQTREAIAGHLEEARRLQRSGQQAGS